MWHDIGKEIKTAYRDEAAADCLQRNSTIQTYWNKVFYHFCSIYIGANSNFSDGNDSRNGSCYGSKTKSIPPKCKALQIKKSYWSGWLHTSLTYGPYDMAATEMHADDSAKYTQLKIYQWAPIPSIRITESRARKILVISGLGLDVSRDFNTLMNLAKNSMSPNSLRQFFFLNISIQNYFQL